MAQVDLSHPSKRLTAANEQLHRIREAEKQYRTASQTNNVSPHRDLTNPGNISSGTAVCCPTTAAPFPSSDAGIETRPASHTAVSALNMETAVSPPFVAVTATNHTAVTWAMRNAVRELNRRRQSNGVGVKPTLSDDSWLGELRAHAVREQQTAVTTKSDPEPTAVFDQAAKMAVYPSVAVAFLAHEIVPVGRVFHLLKHYDSQHGGGGYMPVATVYDLATEMGIGKRRMRMILAEGDGRAWERYKSGRHVYLRLFSPEAVCQSLGAEYSRRRVYLPLGAFFEATRRGQQVTAVKHTAAHFYACIFHLTGKSGVISRETLQALTGVCDETQRHYEWLLRIKSERNYRPTHEPISHGRAYEYGARRNLNIFVYHDFSNRTRRRKPDGERYFVISLPNSYTRPFEIASKGRRYNQQNLATKSRRGTQLSTIFYLDASQAAKKANRQPNNDVLWHGDIKKGAVLWSCMHSIS